MATPRTPALPHQRTVDTGDAAPDLLAAAGLPASGRSWLGAVLRGEADRLAGPLARLALELPLPAIDVPKVLVSCRRAGSAARGLGLRHLAGQLAALDERLVAEPLQALPDPGLAARLRAHLVAHVVAHACTNSGAHSSLGPPAVPAARRP